MIDTLTLGKVTIEECQEFKKLVERKLGLVELTKSLSKANKEVYEQVVSDLGETEFLIKDWWARMSQVYKLEIIPGSNIRINFETCEILAIVPKQNADMQVF